MRNAILTRLVIHNPDFLNAPDERDYTAEAEHIAKRIFKITEEEIYWAVVDVFPQFEKPDLVDGERLDELVADIYKALKKIEKEEPHNMTNKELTQIRETLGLTKKEFAEKLGSTAMMVGRYESGGCKIPDAIADIAKSLIAPAEEDVSVLVKNVRESLSLSKSALAKLIGVSPSAVGNYESGKNKPKDEIIAKIKELVKEESVLGADQAKEESAPVDEKEEATEKIMPEPIEGDAKATSIVIESQMGGTITTEEILSRIPEGCDTVYVKPEENAAYWVKGEESGVVNLW